jgi:carboxymethylenebutenolidase
VSAATTRTHRIETGDGALDAYLALPAGGSGPGLVLIHEIFGVNEDVRANARRLAGLGYAALAPDLFWRTSPGLELDADEAGLQAGMAAVARLDAATAVADAIAALDALRALPEVPGGAAGVAGFCLGGTLAYEVAVADDPDVAVIYYGSGIPAALDRAGAITCPTIMHWGGVDPYIPREQVDAVAAMAAACDGIECHVHEGAGHAFDNLAPMFHVPGARAAAWELTAAFLARELPVAG